MANIQGQDAPLEVASRSMDMHIGEPLSLKGVATWLCWACTSSLAGHRLCSLDCLKLFREVYLMWLKVKVHQKAINMEICADGKYEVWLVLDTNTLMESPEELLSFHSASKDSILPKSGAFKNIDLSISYFIAQAVIRELDSRKQAGHSDGTALSKHR